MKSLFVWLILGILGQIAVGAAGIARAPFWLQKHPQTHFERTYQPMNEDNEWDVATRLGRIEAQLLTSLQNQDRIETRLFGRDGDPDGGVIGQHNRRVKRLEIWVIRVTTAIIVFDFMTGTGPATMGRLLSMIVSGK